MNQIIPEPSFTRSPHEFDFTAHTAHVDGELVVVMVSNYGQLLRYYKLKC